MLAFTRYSLPTLAHAAPQPQSSSRLQRRALAAVQPAGGADGASGSSAGSRWRREHITFVVPNQAPIEMVHVRQRTLYNLFDRLGAIGFEVPGGKVSLALEDLPEGGTAKLVMLTDLDAAPQANSLQGASHDDDLRAKLQLAAFLRSQAGAEAPNALLTTLQTEPFKDAKGKDFVQLHAAVVAGGTVYVGEHGRVLGEDAVISLGMKASRMRKAVKEGTSPDLAAALRGVKGMKLYLCGEAVRAGLAVDELAAQATEVVRACLVLPSGQNLCLASKPPPTVPL